MPTMADTYMRVCTLELGHEGDHLPYYAAPVKDEFRNKVIASPRCLHVDPLPMLETPRYRVTYEMIDPRFPAAGWHEVARETVDLADADQQMAGLRRLELAGDDVRKPRIEVATVAWKPL